MPYSRTSLSPEQALQKARHYCGYQERCHSEVQGKLYSFGLRKPQVEAALATLIEENYLNEERFAIQYAGGHFRLKHWGKVRIRYQLKQKQVSEYCIKKALASIDEDDYERTLTKLAAQKWETLSGTPGRNGAAGVSGPIDEAVEMEAGDADEGEDDDGFGESAGAGYQAGGAGGASFLVRRGRLQTYLLQKGFEAHRVAAVLPVK